ncbi:MFS transporter [Brachybacterium saurashtrense]|uniref:MFS transporter n=1 Tax=Brachybacterium saurashtrense TaxID=556288 RepID=A0A345YSI2_9MICO|nr:MFS transporter [Brachybacterium saurashtrense]AXK46884.1 MFS transporter [Brachybacterium saurashtrense]RRR22599.1 MFS transporter [Brachybacterium saurashtrense]
MIPDPSALTPLVRRKPLLAVLLAPLFMALIAVSVINVALTAIGESLAADTGDLQWVISGYALAFGMLLVPAGRAGDATGRRRMFIVGVGVFTLGSLLSGLAPSAEMLNLARILQGLGSGLLNPQTVALIQQHFRGQDRARAFALLATTVAVATAVGPVVGGALIQILGPDRGWRWMFLMNIPIGVVAIIGAFKYIPDDRARGKGRPDLDPVGAVLLCLAILGIMLPFLERGVSVLVWMSFPAGLLVLGIWWVWERRYRGRGRSPMVDTAIFANRAFRNGILIVSVYFLGATSVWIIVPLFLQMHLGHTPFEASLMGIPSSIAAAISSQISGRYVLTFGRRMVIVGFAVAFAGLFGTAVLAGFVESGMLAFWWLAAPLTLMGLSQGMTISPNQTLTLNSVDPRFGGVAGGILQLGQRTGAAIGTAMIPGIIFALTEGGTAWLEAFVIALTIIMALTLAAMGVSFADRAREKAGKGAL